MNFKKSFYEAWLNKSEDALIDLYNNDCVLFMTLNVSNDVSLLQSIMTYNFDRLLEKIVSSIDNVQINELLLYSLDNTLVGSFNILLKNTKALVVINSRDFLNQLLDEIYNVEKDIFQHLENIEIPYEILQRAEDKIKIVSKEKSTVQAYENLFKLKHAQILNNILPSSSQKTKFSKI